MPVGLLLIDEHESDDGVSPVEMIERVATTLRMASTHASIVRMGDWGREKRGA